MDDGPGRESVHAVHNPRGAEPPSRDSSASCETCGEVPTLESVPGDNICSILTCPQEHVLCAACHAKGSPRCSCEGAFDETLVTGVSRAHLQDASAEMDTMASVGGRPTAKMGLIRNDVKEYPSS